MSLDTHLAVYGTLAPGKPNHHQLDGMAGTWIPGVVRGHLLSEGWAADQGYPALALDPEGEVIEVQVFRSLDLPAHWQRLDEFEGEEYCRMVATVDTVDGLIDAWIYACAVPPEH
jgi:gamma-glutamylcyclotransferase (GGCT)/AIG2-like uncharacterized protein YtfP